jgi:hypothetical protein
MKWSKMYPTNTARLKRSFLVQNQGIFFFELPLADNGVRAHRLTPERHIVILRYLGFSHQEPLFELGTRSPYNNGAYLSQETAASDDNANGLTGEWRSAGGRSLHAPRRRTSSGPAAPEALARCRRHGRLSGDGDGGGGVRATLSQQRWRMSYRWDVVGRGTTPHTAA